MAPNIPPPRRGPLHFCRRRGIKRAMNAPPHKKPRPLTHPEIRTIVLGIMLAMFLGALDQTIVATALPTIGRRFSNLADLSWVVTAYLLTATAVTPLYGKLSDIHGRRAMMLIAIVVFVAGSLACALAPSMSVLIIGARGAGARRRRADGAGADHHRRHRFAARARPLPGLYRRGVRDLLGRRPGARRLPDRASRLVADLLDQSAARPRRARHDLERAEARAVSSAQAPARRDRRLPDDGGGGGAVAGAVLGRAHASTGSRRSSARCC